MIIRRMILENFCLFAGRHEFDLTPRQVRGVDRPIVLFGGKNGAGKTTILRAIELALYGRQAINGRVSEKEYLAALLSMIHRGSGAAPAPAHASVELEFDLVTQGERHSYKIKRSWASPAAGESREYFCAQKDGDPLDDVGPDHWQSFIADIVPERLSQLFFFDGEKIKTIAEDLTGNVAISDAIQTLLGLDTVKALSADLMTLRSRILKEGASAGCQEEMATTDRDLKEQKARECECRQESEQLAKVITKAEEELSELEQLFEKTGGGFARTRGDNRSREGELQRRLGEIEEAVRKECGGELPLALCQVATPELRRDIERDQDVRRARALGTELSALEGMVLRAIARKIPPTSRKRVCAVVESELQQYRETHLRIAGDAERHGMSDREGAHVIEVLDRRAPAQVTHMRELLKEMDAVTRSLRQVGKDLGATPAQEVLTEAFDRLKKKNQEVGMLKQQQAQLSDALRDAELRVADKQRKMRTVESRLQRAQDVAAKTTMIDRLQPALAAYARRLTAAKIAELESEVTECFNRLARKGDFVRRVEIHPESFSVTVIDKHERSIPKADLSSGEKQIFAIAVLWGLARTSGRPLPVVIDTPLGRLDSDHRRNLVTNYFPHAGHQVILLSTDTEVDLPLFKALSPAVSHCYHLEYDESQNRTTASNRYFW